MSGKQLTRFDRPDIGQRVLALRAEGATWPAIATALGVHRVTAWRHFLDAKLTARRRAPRRTRLCGDDARRARAARVALMQTNGATLSAIAAELGISRQTAWRDQALEKRVDISPPGEHR
ncbi:MAG: helix-turn-helix domain-containing protein [Stellaceae bacterium]